MVYDWSVNDVAGLYISVGLKSAHGSYFVPFSHEKAREFIIALEEAIADGSATRRKQSK